MMKIILVVLLLVSLSFAAPVKNNARGKTTYKPFNRPGIPPFFPNVTYCAEDFNNAFDSQNGFLYGSGLGSCIQNTLYLYNASEASTLSELKVKLDFIPTYASGVCPYAPVSGQGGGPQGTGGYCNVYVALALYNSPQDLANTRLTIFSSGQICSGIAGYVISNSAPLLLGYDNYLIRDCSGAQELTFKYQTCTDANLRNNYGGVLNMQQGAMVALTFGLSCSNDALAADFLVDYQGWFTYSNVFPWIRKLKIKTN